jgi:hypothetical protein
MGVSVNVNVNVSELRLGFSNTTRNPEGILSHNNRKSHWGWFSLGVGGRVTWKRRFFAPLEKNVAEEQQICSAKWDMP